MRILTDSRELVGAGNANWRQHMKMAIRKPEELLELLDLPPNSICRDRATGSFPLFVPLPYLSRIEKGNLEDPLLRQVLPVAAELDEVPGFSADPLQEAGFAVSPGLLKKYNERALMVVNGSCAVHCRYCFRSHFPYSDAALDPARLEASVAELKSDQSIREVILSGGDPLTMVDDRFTELVQRLEQIEHLQRLRIHTRLPIMIPQRVTDRLLELFTDSRFEIVMVVHTNHAAEIDAEVQQACRSLSAVCNGLLNQSVLLRGVNDSVEALKSLSERLIACSVIPYYLHQLDPVQGAAHFQVPVEVGIGLVKQLRETTSGYLVPKYVQEIPGELNKTVLA